MRSTQLADRQDQAGLLGQRDELGRRHRAQLGAVPAQQRLDAGDARRSQIELGLVVQRQLVALDGAAQARLQRQPLERQRLQSAVVELEVVLALFLGVVHRDVGVLHQRAARRCASSGNIADADAGGDAALLALDHHRLDHRRQQLARDRGRPARRRAGPAAAPRTRRRPGAPRCRWRAGCPCRRLATSRSSVSPASWPRVSLMNLKRSRSMNSTANLRWLRLDAASTWFSSSANITRLGRPVRLSCVARYSMRSSASLRVGDVARHAAVAAEAAVGVEQRLAADAGEAAPAAPIAVAVLEIAKRFAPLQPRAKLRPAHLAIGAGDLPGQAAAQRLFVLGAHVAAAERGEAQLRIELPIPVGRQLHQAAKTLLALLQRQLGLPARRDVLHDRDVVQRAPCGVALHRDREVHPHGGAVLAEIALLDRERINLAGAQPGAHRVGDVLVVGVRDLLDRKVEHLLAAVAEKLAHPRVHVQVAPGVVDVGDADRRQLDRRCVALLALAQRRLRLRAQAELADLAADVARAIEQLGIQLLRLAAEDLHHAHHAARRGDRERQRAAQAGSGGQRRALEGGLGGHVAQPHRLAGRPGTPRQAAGLAGAQDRHRAEEGRQRRIVAAPGPHAHQMIGGLPVFDPAGAAGPTQFLADGAHDRWPGLVQTG